MISMSVASMVTRKTFARQFVSRSIHNPLNKSYNGTDYSRKLLDFICGVEQIRINCSCVQKSCSLIFREYLQRMSRLGISQGFRSIQRKSVIFIPSVAFLGYHKDGKVRN